MPELIAGFPYWQFQFGEQGEQVAVPDIGSLATDLTAAGVTDLFVFSHGWNNSVETARDLYANFFGEMAPLAGPGASPGIRPGTTIGTAGVIWPSLLWADEPTPGSPTPAGAMATTPRAAPAPAGPSDAQLVQDLKRVFTRPAQGQAIDRLAALLQSRPNNAAALVEFQREMRALLPERTTGGPEDQGQRALVEGDYRIAFRRMATAARMAGVPGKPDQGGAPTLGGPLGDLWDGAKEALRQLSYFTMKERAGVVGQQGLGPLLGSLHAALPSLRVHLLGHSFGARLVSFSLAGLAADAVGSASPIKSLTLLQGAFSHFAFAASLPQDPTRAGELNGMAARVDGPLAVSFSSFDTAVGVLYPWASLAAGQDASAELDPLYPWGAMGHDGAQAVNAQVVAYGPPGTAYPFQAGQFVNLDGNQVIVNGGPPAGAHGDICHPETAWAALVAAGVATGGS